MDSNLVDDLVSTFGTVAGADPNGVWFAPGRVNLIGEHTDYNDGYCLPFALPHRVTVAAGLRPDDRWQVHSVTMGETVQFGRDELRPLADEGWHTYVAGVVWALLAAGYDVPGADLVLTSDVPVGSGLSSSAALECAVLTALNDLGELGIAPMDRAVLARRAENDYVGAPTGLLDQAASTLCRADGALMFDCRELSTTQIPFAPGEHGLEMLILDTCTPHTHVDGEYAERRASCEQASRLLGVPALRDIDLADLPAALDQLPTDHLRRLVRHVVTEDDRVLAACQLLTDGRMVELGPLLDASHTSMRDDFEITVPTVDLAVETVRAHGAIGARMTGGGFGGCIIALVPTGTADIVGTAVAAAFADQGFDPPVWFLGTPSAGAGRLR